MVMMNAVLAIALGLTPAQPGKSVQTIYYDEKDYAGLIGTYQQVADRNGTIHLRGFDRLTAKPFDLALTTDGRVDGTIGDMYVQFVVHESA
jgi:hypothetical protein